MVGGWSEAGGDLGAGGSGGGAAGGRSTARVRPSRIHSCCNASSGVKRSRGSHFRQLRAGGSAGGRERARVNTTAVRSTSSDKPEMAK